MRKNVLDLSTSITRHTIKVDGKAYELRDPDELSLLEQHYLRQWGQDIEESFADESDAEAVSKGEHALRQTIGLLMPSLPAEISERLSDTQRLAIIRGFTRLASEGILASVQNGGSSSPVSSGSTAVAPLTGLDSTDNYSAGTGI